MIQELTVIGLMSGTSLDGLDICCVNFSSVHNKYQYQILASQTIAYPEKWKNKLQEAFQTPREELESVNFEFGQYMADQVNLFIIEHNLVGKIDLIGSHGQTIFHEPDKGITVQIGDGAILAKETGIKVINNFRIKDVELGGQGAPLVPIGDQLLFEQYNSCLNLGGIANISFERDGERLAFDICPG